MKDYDVTYSKLKLLSRIPPLQSTIEFVFKSQPHILTFEFISLSLTFTELSLSADILGNTLQICKPPLLFDMTWSTKRCLIYGELLSSQASNGRGGDGGVYLQALRMF